MRGLAIHRPIVHILLALQLALWSPVLCCCGIKGAIGTVTGVDGTTCAADGCCAKATPDLPESCCDAELGVVDDAAGASKPASDKCRCHERITDRLSIDTGGKVKVPNLSDHLNSLISVAIDFAAAVPMETLVLQRGSAQRAHPPPNSLLRLHCLLLI